MEKKNNSFLIIVAVIILAIIVVVVLKNKNKIIPPSQRSLTQTEQDLNKAVSGDTTKSIDSSINGIIIDDTTNADLNAVDQELNKL